MQTVIFIMYYVYLYPIKSLHRVYIIDYFSYNVMNANAKPKHWKDPDSSISSKSSFYINNEKSLLKISSIKLSDSGRYKCRVDYHLGQTSFQLLDLIVIIPPEKPRIFYNAKQVTDNRVPAMENKSFSLVCESQGNW